MHADDAAPPLGRGIGCWRHPGACVSLRLSNGRESNAPSLASLCLSIASRGGGRRGAADARLLSASVAEVTVVRVVPLPPSVVGRSSST